MSKIKILMLFYALVAVFTFGWSASDKNRLCDRLQLSPESVQFYEMKPCEPVINFLYGITAAPFWPLYWSWTLIEKVRT